MVLSDFGFDAAGWSSAVPIFTPRDFNLLARDLEGSLIERIISLTILTAPRISGKSGVNFIIALLARNINE
jgi:hypothetical protein